MNKRTFSEELNCSLDKALESNERVYLIGEDIVDPYGGAFKVSKGLSSKFPSRVLATPISEAAMVGIAGGMALRGLLPIVEIMFGDFITLCADQIINHLTKYSAMYAGKVNCPVIIRTPMGGGRGYGPTHSQSLEKLFFGIPHLRILAPSHYHQPGNILLHALFHERQPTLFIENKLLYPIKLENQLFKYEYQYSSSNYPTAIVKNYQKGKPDLMVIAYGAESLVLEECLKEMAREEIKCVLLLPCCLDSLPIQIILEYAETSKRVLTVEEGTGGYGFGAEVSRIISEGIKSKVSFKSISSEPTIIPAEKSLESKVLVSKAKVFDGLNEVLFR